MTDTEPTAPQPAGHLTRQHGESQVHADLSPQHPYRWNRLLIDACRTRAQHHSRPRALMSVMRTAVYVGVMAHTDGRLRVSVADLATICGSSEDTISRHLAALTHAGLLVRVQDHDPRTQRIAIYRLTLPPDHYMAPESGDMWHDLTARPTRQSLWQARQQLTMDTPPHPSHDGEVPDHDHDPSPSHDGDPSPSHDGDPSPSHDGVSPYRGFHVHLGMADVGETGTGTRARARGRSAADRAADAMQEALAERLRNPTSAVPPPRSDPSPVGLDQDDIRAALDLIAEARRIREDGGTHRSGIARLRAAQDLVWDAM